MLLNISRLIAPLQGCPQRWAMKQGMGAALVEDPETAKQMIRAVYEQTADRLPCTVKIRLTVAYPDLRRSGALSFHCPFIAFHRLALPFTAALRRRPVDLARQLEAAGAAVLTVHGRTCKMKSSEPVRPRTLPPPPPRTRPHTHALLLVSKRADCRPPPSLYQ